MLNARRWWLLAAVVTVGLVAVLIVLDQRDEPFVRPELAPDPALVGSVRFEQIPGGVVIAHLAIRADRTLRLDDVILRVQDSSGRTADAADRSYDIEIGTLRVTTRATSRAVPKTFAAAGRYTYVIQYSTDGRTRSLPPFGTFTVT